MKSITKKSPAKINLTLDVLNKREDGYHNLQMIMQTIDLCDELTFEVTNTGEIEIITNCDRLKTEQTKNNLIYKAIMKTFEYCNYTKCEGLRVTLNKVIPLEAGLAGGSSNASTAIKAVNKLYNFNLSIDDMIEIGKSVGADVPFCIVGGTALVEGIGDKVTPLPPHIKSNVLVVKPKVAVPTKYIFENLNIDDIESRPNTDKVLEGIKNQDLNTIASNICNTLEVVTIKKYNIINDIKNAMLQSNSLGSIMTGSGSAIYGYFKNKEDMKQCGIKILEQFEDVQVFETSTINGESENY